MRSEHLNPFLRSMVNTFSTVLECEAHRGDIALSDSNMQPFPISGVIGLSGKAVGTVVINFSEEVALKAASAMLMMQMDELNDDVCDAIGEIANMVAGQAKAELEEYQMNVSLPNVISGRDHEVRFPSDARAVSIPFETEFGPLQLTVGLEPVCEPVAT